MVIRKNRMSDFEPVPVEAGSDMKEEFQAVFTPDGGKVLKKVGEFNLYKYIQSFADEVDVNRIVQAATSLADPSLLVRSKGVYADVSGVPSDLATQRDLYVKIIGSYNSLGGDEKYGSIENYFATFVAPSGSVPESTKEAVNNSVVVEDTSGGVSNE